MGQPVVHFEVIGQDPDKLRSYYGELFGWKFVGADGTDGLQRSSTGSRVRTESAAGWAVRPRATTGT